MSSDDDGAILAGEDDGAALLDDVVQLLQRFVVFPSDDVALLVALWVIHTFCLTAFETTPRLAICSAEPRSGKTRLLECIEMLVNDALMTSNTSVAFIFRSIEQAYEAGSLPPVILIDESDGIWGPNSERQDEPLRQIANAGYRQSGAVGRVVGERSTMLPKRFRVFACMAFAGIGNYLPQTLKDRSLIVRMDRKAWNDSTNDV